MGGVGKSSAHNRPCYLQESGVPIQEKHLKLAKRVIGRPTESTNPENGDSVNNGESVNKMLDVFENLDIPGVGKVPDDKRQPRNPVAPKK